MTEVQAPVHGYIAEGDKDALARRMHRIEGQVRGIEKMIADDRYCIDILTQIAAVGTALEAVAFKILDDHVSHCVAGALASGDEAVAAEKGRELLAAVHRFARARLAVTRPGLLAPHIVSLTPLQMTRALPGATPWTNRGPCRPASRTSGRHGLPW
jgi:DNA-binding FrmR family transcriptional regulator